jgi:hypothetical protein
LADHWQKGGSDVCPLLRRSGSGFQGSLLQAYVRGITCLLTAHHQGLGVFDLQLCLLIWNAKGSTNGAGISSSFMRHPIRRQITGLATNSNAIAGFQFQAFVA